MTRLRREDRAERKSICRLDSGEFQVVSSAFSIREKALSLANLREEENGRFGEWR